MNVQSATMYVYMFMFVVVLNDKIKAFVVDLHESYGHPGTNRLIATIYCQIWLIAI